MSQNSDVIIIVAGIVGAACAWRLASAGMSVKVLERQAPGSGASQAALGVLGFQARPNMPADFDDLCRRSRAFYPSIIDELQETIGQRPFYRTGGQLSVALIEDDLVELEEAYSLNREHGISVERPTPDECQLLAPGLNNQVLDSLFYPENAWVDNTALTLAIVQAAELAGAVFERGNAQAVVSEAGRATGVRADGTIHQAEWLVIAAGCWSGQIAGLPPLTVQPVRGQAILVGSQPIQRIVMSERGYLVPKGDGQTMIGATVEQKKFEESNTLAGLNELTAAGLEIAPALGQSEFLGAWAGLRPGTPDDLPYIGPFSELPNVIAATGHFRNGILLAPITAAMVRAAITGETPPTLLQPFLPGRVLG